MSKKESIVEKSMKKIIPTLVARRIKFLVCFPIKLLIGILIWIDWKRHYDGLPIEAWGMPHGHE